MLTGSLALFGDFRCISGLIETSGARFGTSGTTVTAQCSFCITNKELTEDKMVRKPQEDKERPSSAATGTRTETWCLQICNSWEVRIAWTRLGCGRGTGKECTGLLGSIHRKRP